MDLQEEKRGLERNIEAERQGKLKMEEDMEKGRTEAEEERRELSRQNGQLLSFMHGIAEEKGKRAAGELLELLPEGSEIIEEGGERWVQTPQWKRAKSGRKEHVIVEKKGADC